MSAARPSRIAVLPLLGAVLLPLALASDALAKGNIVVAQQLFEKGVGESEKGNTKAACDLFAKSNDEVESVGALQQLGICNEKLGNFATAWSEYKRCESVGATKGDARANECVTSANAIESKRSMVTLKAADAPPGMTVTQDGNDVTSSIGAALDIPMDPGTHKIEVAAPGYTTKTIEITVGNAEKKTVDLPTLEKGSGTGETTGAGGDTTGAGGTTSSGSGAGGGDTGSKGMSGVMIGGLVVGGVGAAGLILGAAMGGAAIGAKSDVETLCPNQTCSTQDGKDALSTAKTDATVSTIGFIAGGVLLAGGAVMVIIGAVSGGKKTEEKKDAASLYLLPTLSPSIFGDRTGEGFNGAVLGGSF